MSDPGGRPEDELRRRDRVFLRVLEGRLAEGAARAGARLVCRLGCTECCRGPFAINRLDEQRLRDGWATLAASDPARAQAVRARAQEAVAAMVATFPGHVASGRLAEDDSAQDVFFSRFGEAPCPALDPATGGCALYAWRPVSCRTYGLPLRLGLDDLPPCRLCFVGAAAEEVEACRVDPDPGGEEDVVLTLLERRSRSDGSTIVAFALARA
ncbi:MAG: zinc/iron-chelating domain-containing protein [Acidobacteria bacterium]|nr:MAG: zinc/iron-chelating domain-containing protein [Acidobacteriota bacterium]